MYQGLCNRAHVHEHMHDRPYLYGYARDKGTVEESDTTFPGPPAPGATRQQDLTRTYNDQQKNNVSTRPPQAPRTSLGETCHSFKCIQLKIRTMER